MIHKRSLGEKVFNVINILFMILFCASILYPYLQQLAMSFTPAAEAGKGGLRLLPAGFSLESYKKVISDGKLVTAYANTLFVVVVGTLISVVVIAMTAYPLSRKELPNKKLWTALLMFTMYFSGGLVPAYLLVKGLHLTDTLFAIILPMVMNVFYVIIMRNFFMSIPQSLIESAKMDGESEFGILFKIVIPLSRPILATVTLWCAVAYWNEWFKAMLYINDTDKITLQMMIRELLGELSTTEINAASADQNPITPEGVRAATIVLSTVPILCVYPFLQKYFVTGIMMGAVKE